MILKIYLKKKEVIFMSNNSVSLNNSVVSKSSVNVLWVSRHELNQDQLAGLKKIVGDNFKITQFDQTIKGGEDLPTGEWNYIALVLPAALLADVSEKYPSATLLVPRSKRILEKVEGGESKVTFAYDGWEVIDQIVYKSHLIK